VSVKIANVEKTRIKDANAWKVNNAFVKIVNVLRNVSALNNNVWISVNVKLEGNVNVKIANAKNDL